MHYIRFLKTPKVEVVKGSILLKAVITVTTDLGETFYPQDLELVATVRDTEQDGDIYLRRKLQWPGGARSLPVSFDLSRQDVEWPACMHITSKTPKSTGSVGFLPPIVDVWSAVVNPTKGQFESGWRVERRFASSAERTVSLLEDAGDSIARHLWDGSQVLAQHIDETISLQMASSPLPFLEYVLVSATYRRLNAIELGCGCGSVGISLAQSVPDCDVLLTDLSEVTELVEANIERMNPAMSSKVHFEPLDWEQPLPEKMQHRKNDLIIVSECTYNSDTLQPLVSTLSNLVTRSPKAVIVVSTKTRHDSEAVFFDLMRKANFVEAGSLRIPLPGEPGNGYADSATDVGLHVFHGRDHRLTLSPRERSEEDVPRARGARRPRSR
ncbi:hypothetical protein LTR97_012658 [Elasticomyces elasticus]|uniref:Uncharacterized protein n=1 Tax=Elasticomyces elasticus TaxID=574655 RepID=A0AAN7ZY10_9PEZI|nr:hypothetical protein LTR97_012658 [Elasticomyces elasticus]